MTTRYTGPGGNDTNNGTSYATRKLTLGGVETTCAAGDLVWVAPGTYRETLTCSINGSAGNIIQFKADLTGINTDGVGGRVRLTGSDDDLVATRTYCLNLNGKTFRTFTGFDFDTPNNECIVDLGGATNIIIEDFTCHGLSTGRDFASMQSVAASCNYTFRRGIVVSGASFADLAPATNSPGIILEDLILLGQITGAIVFSGLGEVIIRNCIIAFSSNGGIQQSGTLGAGHAWTINQCTFLYNGSTIIAASANNPNINEDYNLFWPAPTYSNVTAGTHSVTAPIALDFLGKLLNNGRPELFKPFAALWGSVLNAGTGATGGASTDIYGTARPQGLSNDWGPIESLPTPLKNTVTTRNNSVSIEMPGRGYVDEFVVLQANISATHWVYVKWDSNATIGAKPQLQVLADNGVATQTVTATGDGTSSWEKLSITITPTSDGVGIFRMINQNTDTTNRSAYFADFDQT